MAGHSKWANIQHRKGAQDAKKGKLFTRLIRGITMAARLGMGGPDPAANPRLRLAIDKALDANMTKDTIERAIKRGAGANEIDNVEEIRYEGYGPGGIAVMVDCMTDNRNRTVAEVRHAFTKGGGHLGTEGSVAYLFQKQGVINLPIGCDQDRLLEIALELGVQDVITHDDRSIEILTLAEDFTQVKQALQSHRFIIEQSGVTMRATTTVSLDKENAEKMLALVDLLETLDDVQNVYSNATIAPDILAIL